jgi:hypothetical protein
VGGQTGTSDVQGRKSGEELLKCVADYERILEMPFALALLTHADAKREGARLLSAAGRAAASRAGRELAELQERWSWAPVTVFGTAPAFRCVETLLMCAGQLPPAACDSVTVTMFPELAERANEGLSSERLLSAIEKHPVGTMVLSVQGDLPSALPIEITEHLDPAELESSGTATYFVRRPVLCVLSLYEPDNLATAQIEAFDAFDSADGVQSLLRSDWY